MVLQNRPPGAGMNARTYEQILDDEGQQISADS